jgi:hypothetical protein
VEFTAIDIRQVVAAHAFMGVGQQCLGDQLWAEERTADADVDHVGDRLLGVATPQAVMDAAHQVGDLVQHLVHVGHDIGAVDRQLVAHRAAQCGVQRRTTFRRVDRLAIEQRLDCAFEIDFVGQAHQQVAGFRGNQVFRVIEEKSAAAQRELGKALGIGIKRFAHAEILHGLAMLIERLPGGQSGNVMRGAVIRHRCGFPFYYWDCF